MAATYQAPCWWFAKYRINAKKITHILAGKKLLAGW
jgi:hypothetical protein